MRLNGDPGVYTADWAEKPDGSGRDFMMAMEKVEQALQTAHAEGRAARTARFVSVLCLAWPDGDIQWFRGEVEGTLVLAAKRRAGIWLRSGVSARWPPAHLWRDVCRRKAWLGSEKWKTRTVAPGQGVFPVCKRMSELGPDSLSELAATEADDFGVYVHWPFLRRQVPLLRFQFTRTAWRH